MTPTLELVDEFLRVIRGDDDCQLGMDVERTFSLLKMRADEIAVQRGVPNEDIMRQLIDAYFEQFLHTFSVNSSARKRFLDLAADFGWKGP